MKKRFFMAGIIAVVALSLGACSAVNSGNNVNSTATVQSVENWKPYDANGNILRTDRDATGVNGVVSTGKYEATKIGVDIIKKVEMQ